MHQYLFELFTALCVRCVLLSTSSNAASFGEMRAVGSENLQLNGHGIHNKAFIRAYDVAFLSQASQQFDGILVADEPQAIALNVRSKLAAAFAQSFSNSTNGQTTATESEMASFLSIFLQSVKKRDQFQFAYTPQTRTAVTKNGEEKRPLLAMPLRKPRSGSAVCRASD